MLAGRRKGQHPRRLAVAPRMLVAGLLALEVLKTQITTASTASADSLGRLKITPSGPCLSFASFYKCE